MLRENFEYVSTTTSETAGKNGESAPCSGALTFIEAFRYCEEQGGRLPTREEAKTILPGTGCGYDSKFIWTCEKGNTENTYWCVYGAADGSREDEERKVNDTAYVRWVYDSQNIVDPVIFNGTSETKFNKNGIVDSKSFSECGILDDIVAWMPLDADLTDISTNKQPTDVSSLITRGLRGWNFEGDDTGAALSHIQYSDYSLGNNATISIWAKHKNEPYKMVSSTDSINIVKDYKIEEKRVFTYFNKTNFISFNEINLNGDFNINCTVKAKYEGARMIFGHSLTSNNCMFLTDGVLFLRDTNGNTIKSETIVVNDDEIAKISIIKKDGIANVFVNNKLVMTGIFGSLNIDKIGSRQTNSFPFNGYIWDFSIIDAEYSTGIINSSRVLLNLPLDSKYSTSYNKEITLNNFDSWMFREFEEIDNGVYSYLDEIINLNDIEKDVDIGEFRFFTSFNKDNSQYINLNSEIELTDNFKIELDFATNDKDSNKQIITDPNNDRISITSDNVLQFRLNNTILTGKTYVTDGKLHNVVVKNTNNVVEIYLNGNLELKQPINSGTIRFGRIGCLYNDTQLFDGIIANVKISTDVEIFNMPIDRNYSTSYINVEDSSGNNEGICINPSDDMSFIVEKRTDGNWEDKNGNILEVSSDNIKTRYLTKFDTNNQQYVDIGEPLYLNDDFVISLNFCTTNRSTQFLGGNGFGDSISMDILNDQVRCWVRVGTNTEKILIAPPIAPSTTFADGKMHNVKVYFVKATNEVSLFVDDRYYDKGTWPLNGSQNIRYIAARLEISGFGDAIVSDLNVVENDVEVINIPVDQKYDSNNISVIDTTNNFNPVMINPTENMSTLFEDNEDKFKNINSSIIKQYSSNKRMFSWFSTTSQSYVAFDPIYLGSKSFTMSVDFSTISQRPLITSTDSNNEIVIDTTGYRIRAFFRKNNVLQPVITSNNTYTDSELHNVTLSYDKDLNLATLIVDDHDIKQATWVFDGNQSVDTLGARLNLGYYLDGYLANFKIYEENKLLVDLPLDQDYITRDNKVVDKSNNGNFGTFYNCDDFKTFYKENGNWISENIWSKGQQTLNIDVEPLDSQFIKEQRIYKISGIPDGVLANFGPGWVEVDDIMVSPSNNIRFRNFTGNDPEVFTPNIREVLSYPVNITKEEHIYITTFNNSSRINLNEPMRIRGNWVFEIDFRTNDGGYLLDSNDSNNSLSVFMSNGQIVVNGISESVSLETLTSKNGFNNNKFHKLKLEYNYRTKIIQLFIDDQLQTSSKWVFTKRPTIDYFANNKNGNNGWVGELRNICISIDDVCLFEQTLEDKFEIGNTIIKGGEITNISKESLKYFVEDNLFVSENISSTIKTPLLGDSSDPEFNPIVSNVENNQTYKLYARVINYTGTQDAGWTGAEENIPRKYPFRKSNMNVNDIVGGVITSNSSNSWIALFGRANSIVQYDDIQVNKIIEYSKDNNFSGRYFTDFSSLNQTYIDLQYPVFLEDNFEISFDYCGTANQDNLHILGSENANFRIFVFSDNLYIQNPDYKLCSALSICDGVNHNIKIVRNGNIIRTYIDGSFAGSTIYNGSILNFNYIGKWYSSNYSDGIISNIKIINENQCILDMKIDEDYTFNKNVTDYSGFNSGTLINDANQYIKADLFGDYWEFENLADFMEPDEVDDGWVQINDNTFESNDINEYSSIRYYQLLDDKSQYKVKFNVKNNDDLGEVFVETNDIPKLGEVGDGTYTRIVRNVSNGNFVLNRNASFKQGTLILEELRKVIKNTNRDEKIINFDSSKQSYITIDENIELTGDFSIEIEFAWNDFDTSSGQCLLSQSRFGNFLMLRGSNHTNKNSILFRSTDSSDINFDNVLVENNNMNTLLFERTGQTLSLTINGYKYTETQNNPKSFNIKYIGVRESISHFNGYIRKIKIYDKLTPVLYYDLNNKYSPRDNIVFNNFTNNHGIFNNIDEEQCLSYIEKDGYFISENISNTLETPLIGKNVQSDSFNIDVDLKSSENYKIYAKVDNIIGEGKVGWNINDNSFNNTFNYNDTSKIGDVLEGEFKALSNSNLSLTTDSGTKSSFKDITVNKLINKNDILVSPRYYNKFSTSSYGKMSNTIRLKSNFEINFDIVFNAVERGNIFSSDNDWDSRFEMIYHTDGRLMIWTPQTTVALNENITKFQDNRLHNVIVKYKHGILNMYIDGELINGIEIDLYDNLAIDLLGRWRPGNNEYSVLDGIMSNLVISVNDTKIVDYRMNGEYTLGSHASCNEIFKYDYKNVDLSTWVQRWDGNPISVNYEYNTLTLTRTTTGWSGIKLPYNVQPYKKYLIKICVETSTAMDLKVYFAPDNIVDIPNDSSNTYEFIIKNNNVENDINIVSQSNSTNSSAKIFCVYIQEIEDVNNTLEIINANENYFYEPKHQLNGMLWTLQNDKHGKLDLWMMRNNVYLNTGDSLSNPFNVKIPNDIDWHLYTVTLDHDKLKANLYIDGIFAGDSSYRDPSMTNKQLNIGSYHTQQYSFAGTLSDFRLHNYVMSDEDINIQYQITDPENKTKMKISKNGLFVKGQLKEI